MVKKKDIIITMIADCHYLGVNVDLESPDAVRNLLELVEADDIVVDSYVVKEISDG